jgi:hypothetical protein
MTCRWEERLWPHGDVDQSRVEKDAVALKPPDVRYAPHAVAVRWPRPKDGVAISTSGGCAR